METYRLINEVFLLGDDIDRQLLSRYSLTVRQYHLLNWLSLRGQCGLSELADLLLCDKSNVTGIVRRLHTAGLIEKVANPDRRFNKVQLTSMGAKLHREAEVALLDSIETRFTGVPDSEQAEFRQLLKRIYQRLHVHLDHLKNTSAIVRG